MDEIELDRILKKHRLAKFVGVPLSEKQNIYELIKLNKKQLNRLHCEKRLCSSCFSNRKNLILRIYNYNKKKHITVDNIQPNHNQFHIQTNNTFEFD